METRSEDGSQILARWFEVFSQSERSQILEAVKEKPKNNNVKFCGKAHAWCKRCRPEVGRKISKAKKGVTGQRYPSRNKPTCPSCGGPHNFTKTCAPETIAKRTEKIKQTLKKQGKTGTAQGYRWTAEQRKHRSDAYYSSPAHQAQLKEAGKEGRRQARLRKPTSLEKILHRLLLSSGWEIQCEKRFDPYCVDVYVPSLHLAFEADGYYWHKSRQARYRDRKRDRYLLERYNLPVVRLSEEDLTRVDLGTTIG